MSEIQLPGLATGIDTGAIVQQLMEVNRRRMYALEVKKEYQEEKYDIMTDLQTKLKSYSMAVENLADSSDLRGFAVSTSDSDFLTASANSNASEGNHAIQVKQLATSERWVHDGYKYSTSFVGAGNFIFSYNNEELVVQTSAITTLDDLVGLINNDTDNPGVTASILKYDDGSDGVYHLVLNGQGAGTDYAITVNDSNTEVHTADTTLEVDGENATKTTKINDLDGSSGDITAGDKIVISGNQHDGTAVSYDFNINEYSTIEDLLGEIEDAFDDTVKATYSNGTIKITDTTFGTSSMTVALTFVAGGSATLTSLPTLSQTTQGGSIAADVATLASSTFTQTQAAQDAKIRVDGYPISTSVAEVQELASTGDAASGTYTLSFGGETTTDIAYDADTATVQGLLNGLSTIAAVGGVTVGGTPPSDSSENMTITFADTAGDVGDITIVEGMDNDHTMSTTTEGNDSWISRSTNSIDDVLAGVTINLHDDTWNSTTSSYDSEEITVTRDTESLKGLLETLVTEYNNVYGYIKEQTSYDEKTNTSGPLAREYVVRTVKSMIKSPLNFATSGFTSDDSFYRPQDIGLEFNTDGMLKLVGNTFDEAISDDYLGVLELIGAVKTGTSDSEIIKFYEASKYTTAGVYNVEVQLDASNEIISAKIWGEDETIADARDATFDGNVITGDSTFDSQGFPVYDENNLYFTIDLSQGVGIYTAVLTVKQGFAGALDESMDDMLDSVDGRVPISISSISDKMSNLDDLIEIEQTRLATSELRLINKFARLEKLLSLIQQQMGGLMML
jgi:flagellar hook-associated protein 2